MQFRYVLLGAFLFAPAAHAQATSIPQIQGTTDVSPLSGRTVTVEGIVTGAFQGKPKFSGFFIQDPKGDDNPATSDGIFVYQGTKGQWVNFEVKSGDRVRITGTVEEYKEQTQLSRVSNIEVVGKGGVPSPIPISLPLVAGTNFEQYEGMLVTFSQPLVVAGQYQLQKYGQFVVAPTRQFNPTNVMPIEKAKALPSLSSSMLAADDGSNDANPSPIPYVNASGTLRAGTTVRNLTGILSYSFGEYKLEPTAAPTFEDTNPRPTAPSAVGGELKVAAANVLNYWTTFKDAEHPNARGADDAAQFARQSSKLVTEFKGLDADVVGIMEMQNNGTTAIGDFVGKLNAAYGSNVYAFVADPETGTGTDAIKVALIYKPARVALVGASLSDPSEIFERKPLAQTFRDKQSGGVFTVIVNHFKSKGSAPDNGDTDQGQGAWNQKRTAQAKQLLKFIDEVKTRSGDPDIVAVGDFNAYAEETPVLTLRAAGLKHLNLRLAPEERYSFTFNNLFGSLDHAFASPSLDGQVTGFTEWHVNSDEPTTLSYENVSEAGFVPTPYRASDHDPLLIGLKLTADAPGTPKPVATTKPVVQALNAKTPVKKATAKTPVKKTK